MTTSGAEIRPTKIEAPLWRDAVVPMRISRSARIRLKSQPQNSVASQPIRMVSSITARVGGPNPSGPKLVGRNPTETVSPRTVVPGACSSPPPTATASPPTWAPGSSRTEPNTATTLPVTGPSTVAEPNTETTSPSIRVPGGTWTSANTRTRPWGSPTVTIGPWMRTPGILTSTLSGTSASMWTPAGPMSTLPRACPCRAVTGSPPAAPEADPPARITSIPSSLTRTRVTAPVSPAVPWYLPAAA